MLKGADRGQGLGKGEEEELAEESERKWSEKQGGPGVNYHSHLGRESF